MISCHVDELWHVDYNEKHSFRVFFVYDLLLLLLRFLRVPMPPPAAESNTWQVAADVPRTSVSPEYTFLFFAEYTLKGFFVPHLTVAPFTIGLPFESTTGAATGVAGLAAAGAAVAAVILHVEAVVPITSAMLEYTFLFLAEYTLKGFFVPHATVRPAVIVLPVESTTGA